MGHEESDTTEHACVLHVRYGALENQNKRKIVFSLLVEKFSEVKRLEGAARHNPF